MVGSAALVAVMVYWPGDKGAVNTPLVEIVPLVADQVTAVFVAPVTVAVSCRLPAGTTLNVVGDSEMATVADSATFAVAVADREPSAFEVAVTT